MTEQSRNPRAGTFPLSHTIFLNLTGKNELSLNSKLFLLRISSLIYICFVFDHLYQMKKIYAYRPELREAYMYQEMLPDSNILCLVTGGIRD
jgi:hypothetical protein